MNEIRSIAICLFSISGRRREAPSSLASIRERVMESGAKAFYSAVFANKEISKSKPIAADFVGVTLPDRYVFGFGMDIYGSWRNLPAIYAVKK